MKIKILIFVSVLILLLNSCEDSEVHLPKEDYSSAIQLEKGNYWLYKYAAIDLESGLRIEHLDDSIFIRKDTIVDNRVYYIVENMFGLRQIKTNLSGNIIDINNNIEFSASNFTDTLYKDLDHQIFGMMKKVSSEVTVPAGTFKTVMFIVFQKNAPGHNHNANNPSVFNHEYSIRKKVWYAEKVGVVKSVFYYGNFTGFENSLVRYKVN